MIRRLALLSVPLLLLVTTACTAETEAPTPNRPDAVAGRPSPFQDCAALTAAPDGSGGSAVEGAAGGELLPELTLTCFTGGAPVALREVRGPAVVNIWASWCPPCRKELPAFQRLSERAEGQLRVIGVNSQDSRGAAQSIGEDFGVRFPMLVDQGEAVQRALHRKAFPLTIFVAADGRIRHIDTSGALDDARLTELVQQHLGLSVPA
ncbi:alkyl hydroperoxide reductase [Micromonospora craterilacus]|uniref:Alkyl hydroperoxide reductase n=1 Tax=Micromonospora craterilacus TaxID=1655439 RepID=A0A2W2D885_9ACTN|nr:TlpA disulfide reductase family protein [Micromonospora craterilacus]PZG07093.1 alkyl hydroperoxide reductase [Micromonospora craterilacus]